ncbi:MAG: transcriptional regulator [Paenibacillus sp. RIFOXYA1_FULL_44_5]|nr:MAG: transcriptional regulator [Paenibacillus sp. RIFOXYA1_FULL_44_5]
MEVADLDELDLSIIRLLQQDGRMAYTEIAKQLKVSEGTVRSRTNRMLSEKTFEFIVHVNPNKIGLHTQAIIGLQTQMGMQEQVASELVRCPEVRFVAAFSGAFDLILQAYFESNKELVEFMNTTLAKMEGVLKAEVSLELKQYKDTFNFVNE